MCCFYDTKRTICSYLLIYSTFKPSMVAHVKVTLSLQRIFCPRKLGIFASCLCFGLRNLCCHLAGDPFHCNVWSHLPFSEQEMEVEAVESRRRKMTSKWLFHPLCKSWSEVRWNQREEFQRHAFWTTCDMLSPTKKKNDWQWLKRQNRKINHLSHWGLINIERWTETVWEGSEKHVQL